MELNYTIPKHLDSSKDFLWMEFKAYYPTTYESYLTNEQNPDSKISGTILGTWKMLAPLDIMENITHAWTEVETVYANLGQKVSSVKRGVGTIKEGGRNIGTFFKKVSEGELSTNTMGQLSVDLFKIDAQQYKMDMPIMYTGSEKLQYSMTFNLAIFTDKGADPKKDIFDPVRELERLTCPSLDQSFTKISFPAVFSIRTIDSDLINIPRAALTAVQPTWKAPYKNGYPMSCELQITFINLRPLYKNNFEGNKITTNNPHESNY